MTSQNEIIDLIARWRMITAKLLSQALGKSATQVKNQIRKLRSEDQIQSFPFIGKQVYYTLTESVRQSFGHPKSAVGPLGPQALRDAFAVAEFAYGNGKNRHFLSDPDRKLMQSLSEDGTERLPSGPYFLDVNESEDGHFYRLGVPILDRETEPNSLIQKANKFISKHSHNDVIRQLIVGHEFVFTFITESDSKADAIAEAAQRADLSVPFRFHVNHDLSQL